MVIRSRRFAWHHSTTFEGRFSCAQNAQQPMEAKRHIERTVGFGDRGGAINQIKSNKEQRYQVKIKYPGENI